MINPVFFFFFTPNQTLVVSHFYKYLGYELNEKCVCWFYNISFFFSNYQSRKDEHYTRTAL